MTKELPCLLATLAGVTLAGIVAFTAFAIAACPEAAALLAAAGLAAWLYCRKTTRGALLVATIRHRVRVLYWRVVFWRIDRKLGPLPLTPTARAWITRQNHAASVAGFGHLRTAELHNALLAAGIRPTPKRAPRRRGERVGRIRPVGHAEGL